MMVIVAIHHIVRYQHVKLRSKILISLHDVHISNILADVHISNILASVAFLYMASIHISLDDAGMA